MLKKYADEKNRSAWKATPDHFLSEIGGKFILLCNFDTRKLSTYLPTFYGEYIDARSPINKQNTLSYEDVVNQIIWNNQHIIIHERSFLRKVLWKGTF